MTAAGYINNQLCPENPEHGKVLALDSFLHCPHSGHTPVDPEQHTRSTWTYDEWEAIKSGEPIKSPTTKDDTTKPRAMKLRKPRAGSNRRRTR